MIVDILRILVGLAILIVAADRLVLSAVRVAKVLNVSAVVIGAVIVGFGTSVPEFAVSAVAASRGEIDLAMSNVVASNIANVTLVLGVGGVLIALSSRHSIIRREGFLMLGSVVLFGLVLLDGSVGRVEGVVLLVGLAVALLLLLRWSKASADSEVDLGGEDASDDASTVRFRVEILYGLAALVATVVASQVLLEGVVNIGDEMGLSVVFMGLITGVGTSLPELSAAVAGARRGQADLILGNVLGSNTFNSLGVAGLAAIIGPGSTSEIGLPLIVVMVGAAVLAGIFAYTRQAITKVEAVVLLLVFVGYAILST